MKNIIWFCVGFLSGRFGIPLAMHLFYWSIITLLLLVYYKQ
jgi:hypothetical protein